MPQPRISPEHAREMRHNDLAMTLGELSVAFGFSYDSMRKMAREPWFPPLTFGRVLPSHFERALANRGATQSPASQGGQSLPPGAPLPPVRAAGKRGARPRCHG